MSVYVGFTPRQRRTWMPGVINRTVSTTSSLFLTTLVFPNDSNNREYPGMAEAGERLLAAGQSAALRTAAKCNVTMQISDTFALPMLQYKCNSWSHKQGLFHA